MTFRIYYALAGNHYHLRIFINSALSGTLIMREDEFISFRDEACTDRVEFLADRRPLEDNRTTEGRLG